MITRVFSPHTLAKAFASNLSSDLYTQSQAMATSNLASALCFFLLASFESSVLGDGSSRTPSVVVSGLGAVSFAQSYSRATMRPGFGSGSVSTAPCALRPPLFCLFLEDEEAMNTREMFLRHSCTWGPMSVMTTLEPSMQHANPTAPVPAPSSMTFLPTHQFVPNVFEDRNCTVPIAQSHTLPPVPPVSSCSTTIFFPATVPMSGADAIN
mmetsp:Transcript_5931/g.11242  ORF Transcript_5931/g.11242 Transcript_5931/m.11242 type:complete len:210 (-) Transcript_5931:131-760(-)